MANAPRNDALEPAVALANATHGRTYTREQLELGVHARPALERGDARDAGRRLPAQSHADVLGQADPRLSASTEEAYASALALSDRWLLEGRDCSSQRTAAGCSASTTGRGRRRPNLRHRARDDRRRPRAQTDPEAYVAKVAALERRAGVVAD
jgi:hypothetical protein